MFELMMYSEPVEVDIIEKCLESVLNKDVKVLDIDLLNHQDQSADFSIDVEQPMVTQSPTYGLNHIELNIRLLDNLSVYEALVDAILWCCRPQSLTLISDFSAISFEERTRVVEFTYKKLLQQEAQGKTNIQFALSSYNPKMIFSLPESVPTTLQRMTFIKEEGVPEEEFGDITIKAMQMWKDDQLN
ncbi:hypothetical protein Tco_1061772 [Tanacetum coccineum]